MNKLPLAKRVQILSLLCEGMSMRAVSRLADVSINTVTKLLVDAGRTCIVFHDTNVRNVRVKRVQMDEIWSFCYAKAKNVAAAAAAPEGAGDVWTWTALDADSKLIVSWLVGGRDQECAYDFVRDVRDRVVGRTQITSDAYPAYIGAVLDVFGDDADYATVTKIYGQDGSERRYSPAICKGVRKDFISGVPSRKHVSTSFVERSNLTLRMHNRRFTRLTNAFSKKLDNHIFMVAIYTVFYNWMKLHKTTRVTPAMAAGLTDRVMDMIELVALIDRAALVPAT